MTSTQDTELDLGQELVSYAIIDTAYSSLTATDPIPYTIEIEVKSNLAFNIRIVDAITASLLKERAKKSMAPPGVPTLPT